MLRGSLSLWTRRQPLATHGIAHSTRTEILTHSTWMSHIRNSVQPAFYLIRMSHIRISSPPTFHPGISHPEFFSADIPPGYLTSRFLLGRHSTRASHIRNSSPSTFHPDISHPKFCSANIPPPPNVSHLKFCPSLIFNAR